MTTLIELPPAPKPQSGDTQPAHGHRVRRVPSGLVSAVAWIPSEELGRREWVAVGRRFGSVSRCSQWWVGDWVRYGDTRWGERYTEAARITGYDVKSLRNMAYVAVSFRLSRRRDNLTWSHHAELASLTECQQEDWLDRAIADRLSVADLRLERRAWQQAELKADGCDAPSPRVARRRLDDAGTTFSCPYCGNTVELTETTDTPGST